MSDNELVTEYIATAALTDAKKSFEEYEGKKSVRMLNTAGGAASSDAVSESLPVIQKVVEGISKVHPFVGAALLAFQAVIALDKKRRDNDKKVAVVFVEMGNMFYALKPLLTIQPLARMPTPDGTWVTVEERLAGHIENVIRDIKKCANVCDVYAKKHLITKVFNSTAWGDKLADLAGGFVKHRELITFELSIHAGAGIDDARRHLQTVDAKIDEVRETLKSLVPPPEIQKFITRFNKLTGGMEGGMPNDESIKELLKHVPASSLNLVKRREGEQSFGQFNKFQGEKDFLAIKTELSEKVEEAIRGNLQVFEHKFSMQLTELQEGIQKIVRHEGDRVIDAVTSGAHDRILDPTIHDIWLEMRWPGHVKARHFVIALRDHYRQQMEKKKRDQTEGLTGIKEEDEWTLDWITPNRLQALAEAFDDDASGFITIAEVNQLTSSRPQTWSLPHWLAYWSIGWQMSTIRYADKIREIRAKMLSMPSHLPRVNRFPVLQYLNAVWKDITTLTGPFASYDIDNDALYEKFKKYVDDEESRLEEKLKSFDYKIDALDTLSLITGPGRIEKYFMPLLYLLVRRDFEAMLQCGSKLVDEKQLNQSCGSILWVVVAVRNRHDDLEALFRQQRLDPVQQFKFFASGCFETMHDSEQFWSLKNLRTETFYHLEYDEWGKEEMPDRSAGFVVDDHNNNNSSKDPELNLDSDTEDALKMIVGRWNGFQGTNRWPHYPMLSFFIVPSVNSGEYEGSDVDADGLEFKILGTYEKQADDGSVVYSFSLKWVNQNNPDFSFLGTLQDDGMTLSGTWGTAWDTTKPFTFLFKRVPQTVLIARPPPEDFDRDRIKALWAYALTAARNEARRKLFQWSYVKERLGLTKQMLDIWTPGYRAVEGDSESIDDKRAILYRQLTRDELQAFDYVWKYWRRLMPTGVICDTCKDWIYGSRMVCLECGSRGTFDFCDKESCYSQVVETRDDITSPHLPTHDFMKIRGDVVYYLHIGKVFNRGKQGMERANRLLEEAAKASQAVESSGNADENPVSEVSPALKCVSCSNVISRPCWFCVDCPEDTKVFVCKSCDDKRGGIDVDKEGHKKSHNLVRCMKVTREDEPEDGQKAVEKRLDVLEARLTSFASQLERIEQLFLSLHQLQS